MRTKYETKAEGMKAVNEAGYRFNEERDYTTSKGGYALAYNDFEKTTILTVRSDGSTEVEFLPYYSE